MVTDDHLRFLATEQALTQEDVAFFLKGPVSVSLESQTRILAITDISVLPDGRVGAFVVTGREFAGTDTAYTIFIQQDGRWLVDESIEFL